MHRIGSLRLNYGEENNLLSILFPAMLLLSSNGHHYSSHSSMHHASLPRRNAAMEPIFHRKDFSSLTVREDLLYHIAYHA